MSRREDRAIARRMERAWAVCDRFEALERADLERLRADWDRRDQAWRAARNARQAEFEASRAMSSAALAVERVLLLGYQGEGHERVRIHLSVEGPDPWALRIDRGEIGLVGVVFGMNQYHRVVREAGDARSAWYEASGRLHECENALRQAEARVEDSEARLDESLAAYAATEVAACHLLRSLGRWPSDIEFPREYRCRACPQRPVLANIHRGFVVVCFRHRRGRPQWTAHRQQVLSCDCGAAWPVTPARGRLPSGPAGPAALAS